MNASLFPDPLLAVTALVSSCLGTLAFRRILLRAAILDVPNERSSHSEPIARGGGLVFVAVSSIWLVLLVIRGELPAPVLAALAGLVAIALVGFLDDRRPLGAASRLTVHMLGAAATVFAATYGENGLLPPDSPEHQTPLFALLLLLVLASAWMVNLVNFIDGVDGLASLGGAAILVGATALSGLSTTAEPLARDDAGAIRALALIVAASVAGFGLVNVSRWRIFMGDAGSGALGIAIAFVLIALADGRGLTPLAAITLPALFVSDATATLVVRMLRREHPARAHRTHAYQRLLRLGLPHLAVTGVYLVMFACVVLPVAIYAQLDGRYALWAALALYAALSTTALLLGAGREPPCSSSKPTGATRTRQASEGSTRP